MITLFRRTIIGIAMLLISSVAGAQDSKRNYEPYPHMFVDVQGGYRTVTGDLWDLDLVRPSAQLSFGGYINRYLGGRFAVNGLWGKSVLDDGSRYKYNALGGDIDLLFDVTNVFLRKDKCPLHFVLFAGVGILDTWKYKYETFGGNPIYPSYLSGNHYTAHARVGAQLRLALCKLIDLNMEVNTNIIGSRNGLRVMNEDDRQVAAYLGLAFKFGQKKRERIETAEHADPHGAFNAPRAASDQASTNTATTISAAPKAKPEPSPKTEVAPAPAVAPAEMEQHVFFAISSDKITASEMEKVAKLADFLTKYPKATVTIVGYADRGTGRPDINMQISKARAERVTAELCRRGVNRDRVKTDFVGDAKQPFSDNDRNRVVVCQAKEN